MAPSPWGNSFFLEIQNSIPAKLNMCYRYFSFLSKGNRIHDRSPRDFPFGLEPGRAIPVDGRAAGDAERVAHFRSGTAMERGRSPSRKLDSGFADGPLPAPPKALRRKSFRTALGEQAQEIRGEIFLPANP
jgi:hypothetical protein